MPESLPTVGFIGLGNMGRPMARRLLAAGYPLRAFDVSARALDELAASGALPAATAVEAVHDAAVVILMLPDSGVVEGVVTDGDFLAALTPGTTVLDMSSSEPARTRRLAELLAGREVQLADAPVSGGVSRAVSGELAIMVGGADDVVLSVQPLLERMGRIFRAGPVGAGHAVKALNNLMSATHLLVTSEAILAGERFGLDAEAMLAIFNASSGRSGSTENKWPNFVLPGTFDSGFGLRLMLKDMRIAAGMAEQLDTPSRLGDQAVTLWSEAAEALPADADHTEIVRWLRQANAATAAERH